MYVLSILMGLLLFFAATVFVLSQDYLLACSLLLLSVGLILHASRRNRLRREQETANATAECQRTLDAIAQRRWPAGQVIKVLTVSHPFVTLVFLGFAAFFYLVWHQDKELSIGLTLIVLVLSFFAVMLLAQQWAYWRGGGCIQLSAEGFRCYGRDLIPWQVVDSVGLSHMIFSFRGREHHLARMYFVLSDAKSLPLIYHLQRLLRACPAQHPLICQIAHFPLPPEDANKLCRALWTQATGRTHEYDPDRSAAFNRSLREEVEIRRELNALHEHTLGGLRKLGQFDPSTDDEARALADLEALKENDSRHRQALDQRLLAGSQMRHKEKVKSLKILGASMVLLMLLFLFVPLISRAFA